MSSQGNKTRPEEPEKGRLSQGKTVRAKPEPRGKTDDLWVETAGGGGKR